jgi:hypothetical protein
MEIATLEALRAFRDQVYTMLQCRRDALFELMDAVLAAPIVRAPVHLSQVPSFQRKWGSVYDALRAGSWDWRSEEALLAAHPLEPNLPYYAVDATVWPRCDAETSPDRGYYHHSYRQSHGQPIVAGWAYHWLAQIHLRHDSWTAPLAVRRLHPLDNVNAIACEQIRALLRTRPATRELAIVACDAGYDPIELAQGLEDVTVGLIVRLRSGRCFYADPDPAHAARTGRPRRHGRKFACAEPRSWWPATTEHQEQDAAYGQVRVRSWAAVHAKPQTHPGHGTYQARPLVRGTLLLLEVERLPRHTRPPEPMWLWWWGPAAPDLALIWRVYLARFTLEHTFRFFKQSLGWTTPRLRYPDQADRWTGVLLLAYEQLRLARALVADCRLPWERPLPARKLTPGRVWRAFPQLLVVLGSPVKMPKPCGRSPGRPRGARSPPAHRYAAVKKSP